VRKMSRREAVLLGGLVLVAVGYFWYAYVREDPARPGGRPAGAAAAVPASDAPVVRLDLLARAPEPYNPNGRDLFKYTDRPPTSEEIAKLRAEAAAAKKAQEMAEKLAKEQAERDRIAAEERARIAATLPPPPPPKPQPPPITFRYIGLLGPKEDHLAVFEEGKDIFVARKGDVLKGQFKLIDFKYESVVLGYTRADFADQRQELRMVTK